MDLRVKGVTNDFFKHERPIPADRRSEFYSGFTSAVTRLCELNRDYRIIANTRSPEYREKLERLEEKAEYLSISIAEFTQALKDDIKFTKKECGFSAKEIKPQDDSCERYATCAIVFYCLVHFLLSSRTP